MLVVVSKVLVVFIYIGVGFVANRLKVLPAASSKYFIDLIMEITVPCLVLSSITGQDLDGGMYRNTILTFVLTAIGYVIVAVATTFLSGRLFPHLDQQDINVLAASMTGNNSGFMGFPVTKAVFGPLAFYYMLIQNISNNLYLFVMINVHLRYKEKKASERRDLREVLKPFANITTVATVVAIVMLFSGIHFPAFAMDILTTIGDITIPLSMILMGVQLGGSHMKDVFSNRDLLISSGIKLIVAPSIIMLFVTPLPVDNIVKLTAVLGTCFPSAVVGVAAAARENKNSKLMAEAVANSTALSMITLPIWIMICTRAYL